MNKNRKMREYKDMRDVLWIIDIVEEKWAEW